MALAPACSKTGIQRRRSRSERRARRNVHFRLEALWRPISTLEASSYAQHFYVRPRAFLSVLEAFLVSMHRLYGGF